MYVLAAEGLLYEIAEPAGKMVVLGSIAII